MVISRSRNRRNLPDFYINGDIISEVDTHTHTHTHTGVPIPYKCSKSIDVKLSYQEVVKIYKTIIRPVLDFGAIIYEPCLKSLSEAIVMSFLKR